VGGGLKVSDQQWQVLRISLGAGTVLTGAVAVVALLASSLPALKLWEFAQLVAGNGTKK